MVSVPTTGGMKCIRDTIFIALCTAVAADPLIAFAFLQAFHEILQDYFGTVSTATLKDNFDIVYQV